SRRHEDHMRLGTRNVAAAAPAGPLKVSTTRRLITSAALPASGSTEETSAEKSEFAHSYHCAGCASWANRHACAVPIRSGSARRATRRGVISSLLPCGRARCHVIDHGTLRSVDREPEVDLGRREETTPGTTARRRRHSCASWCSVSTKGQTSGGRPWYTVACQGRSQRLDRDQPKQLWRNAPGKRGDLSDLHAGTR